MPRGSLLVRAWSPWSLARVDCSFRGLFFVIHNGNGRLPSIYSRVDPRRSIRRSWLPPMARLEKIGCYGLTEPLVGPPGRASGPR